MDSVASAAKIPTRQIYFDLFRIFAAVQVVLFHFHKALGWNMDRWFAFPGVDLFFVLSGMVLGARYGLSIELGRTSWRSFAWHRLRRLYPQLFLAGLLLGLLSWAGLPPGTVLEAGDTHPQGSWLLLPCWHGCDVAFPDNPPTWSLFGEVVANASWFVLLAWWPRVLPAFTALAGCIFLAAVWRTGVWHLGWSPGAVGIGLGAARACMGFMVGYFLRKYTIAREWRLWPLLVMFVICYVLQISGSLESLHPALALFLMATSGALLMAKLAWIRPRADTRWARICVWLGGLSYPLYLNQAAAGRLGEYCWRQHWIPAWMAFFLLPLVIGVFAYLFYRRVLAPWLEPRLQRLEFR